MNIREKPKLSLSTFNFILVLLGIFFIPFNSYEGISFLGEFAKESSTIFFLLAFVVFCIDVFVSKKVPNPLNNPICVILSLFLLWLILCTVFNFGEIKDYYFKKTSGFERFIRQYGALIISAVFFLFTYYHVFQKRKVYPLFLTIRKIFFWSLVVVSIYIFLEVAIIKLNFLFLMPVINLFNYFPFTEVDLDLGLRRISSVTFETPALATYLFTIAGWMFSYVVTEKGLKRFIPALLVVVFSILSGSRAALFVIFVQVGVFLLYMVQKRKFQPLLIKMTLAVGLLIGFVMILKGQEITEYVIEKSTSFALRDDQHSISNKSRFGIQYALFQVFLENPVSGVGFGQQAFAAENLYPYWATNDNWEFELKYLNENHENFPPGYNIYLRLLAETGIVGFLLFISLLAFIFYVCYQIMRWKSDKSVIGLVIFISMAGFALDWLKTDTFRVFGFWICLAFLMRLTSGKFKIGKKANQLKKND